MVIRTRGAQSNPQSRYISLRSEPLDDGWSAAPAIEPASASSTAPTAAVTSRVDRARERSARGGLELLPDRTRSLITRNQSPDIPFEQSINPYKGCEHGCIYCFARPTHAYLDLSPGLDFERKIFYKTNVRGHLRQAFAAPGYQPTPIAIGTNTDPYQPVERTAKVMREVLESLLAHRHPVTIVTKGQGILRDLDLLRQFARLNLIKVMVSVTTLSTALKARLEPRTAGPAKRLAIIQALAAAGVPVGAMVAPVIPFINDSELEDIVAACAARGAGELQYILLRLPLEVKDLFEEWLQTHYPLRAERVMSVIRQSRGGRAYDASWGQRMRGTGVFADLLEQRFRRALNQQGLASAVLPPLRSDLFRSHLQDATPALHGRGAGRQSPQGDLFAAP